MTAEITNYQFDTVEVRPAACEVLRDGKLVSLEPKAFRVLLYLIENRDRAVAKDELIRAVWQAAAVTDNALTRIIAQLRRELGDDARQARYIQTLPTLGYRFVAELKVLPATTPVQARTRRPVMIALVAVVLAAAVGLAWRTRPDAGSSNSPVPLHPVQVTSSPDLDAGGSFSPDGKSIVYSSNRSGRFELYVQPLGGGGHEVAITSDSRQNIEPAWSPDGQSIAYHSAGAHGIWIVPSSGGTPRQVSKFGSAPAWSPDSRTLAFRSVEPHSFALFDMTGIGDSTIWTVAADGTGLRQLTAAWHPDGQHASPAWSPDGRQIAFAALWSQKGLWTVDVATADVKPLPTGSIAFQGFPVYGPDVIYFVGLSRYGGFSIYRVSATGGEPAELHEGSEGLPLQMAISHDGRRILYTRCWSISQLWQTSGDSSPPKALYRDMVVRARVPAFTPDGKRIAYLVLREGTKHEIWTMNADGSAAASVTSDTGAVGAPLWNADGSAILYTYGDQNQHVARLNPADGSKRALFGTHEPMQQPHITPDEQAVVFSSGHPMNIWKRRFADGKATQLTFDREGASFPSLSWDGKWISYELQRGNTTQIGLMDSSGGQQSVLTEDPGLNWSNSWALDNRRIEFASYRDGVWNI